MKPPVVIPAYQPGPELEKLVKAILSDGGTEVIIVDDGSSREQAAVFPALARLPGVHLLRHEANKGKGQALKTAFNYFLTGFPEASPGIVTADADGQHLPGDIASVSRCLSENGDALCLGTRRFKGVVPAKSLFGNTLTRLVFRVFSGRAVSDTQTGLRGIPRAFLPDLIKVRAGGYAFELEMLLMAVRSGMKITEVPIETVYMKGNAHSHFSPLLDSLRIYSVFLQFAAASLRAMGSEIKKA
jgi:glycosyltransferase involved in cell wall biosynthesis